MNGRTHPNKHWFPQNDVFSFFDSGDFEDIVCLCDTRYLKVDVIEK